MHASVEGVCVHVCVCGGGGLYEVTDRVSMLSMLRLKYSLETARSAQTKLC